MYHIPEFLFEHRPNVMILADFGEHAVYLRRDLSNLIILYIFSLKFVVYSIV